MTAHEQEDTRAVVDYVCMHVCMYVCKEESLSALLRTTGEAVQKLC